MPKGVKGVLARLKKPLRKPTVKERGLYHKLVEHFTNGKQIQYIAEIKAALNISDEKKKENIANAILKMHNSIIEKHSNYVMQNYGPERIGLVHTTLKPFVDHIEHINRTDPRLLETDFLHKPIWGEKRQKKSILDLISSKISSSPQSQYLRFIHVTGALINHAKEIEKSDELHKLYAAGLARGDDKVLKNINVALTIIKKERPNQVDKYIKSFEKIIQEQGMRVNKRNARKISRILLLLAAHSSTGVRRVPKTRDELIKQLAKQITPKIRDPEKRKRITEKIARNLENNIEILTTYVLMNRALYDPDILPKVHEIPEIDVDQKEEILDKMADYVFHHMQGISEYWVDDEIERPGRKEIGDVWDHIKKFKTNIKAGHKEYTLIFDKTDIRGQIDAIEKLQSCYTPPSEGGYFALSYILKPYLKQAGSEMNVLVPGFVRAVDERGETVGRFTLMIMKTQDNKFRLMATSLMHGPVPKEVVDEFLKRFSEKLENAMPGSVISAAVVDKKLPDTKVYIPGLKLYDDGLVSNKGTHFYGRRVYPKKK